MLRALAPYATRRVPNGMVCSVDQLASAAGVAVMRAGGNAVDAAVATSAVLTVVWQHGCGLGGDLFALVHDQAGAPAALDAAGSAGSGADAARLRAEGATVMPFRGDIRCVTVPGCVDGWLALHDRYGRAPLADVLGPAVGYAEGGFPASPTLAASAALVADLPGAEDFARRMPIRPGDRITRPGVARTLRAVVEGGRAAFYEGEFGQGLVALGAGEFTAEDLARPQARWVEPLHVDAWGRRIWTVPPPSQGYLTLAGAWVAAGLALPDDPDDPGWAHLLVETARQVGHDRPAVLHDAADGAALIAPGRLAPRRAAVDARRAAALGDPVPRAGGTIHLAAVDPDRMGVSLIQSNAAGFGAHIVEPSTGIFLHNRGTGFSLEPGHPAAYGPGRRPPHTLAPALLTRPGDGSLAGVLGTMGGDSQPQVLLQLLARLLVHGEEPGPALAAGRWVLGAGETGFDTWSQGGAVTVRVEGHAPGAWDAGLAERGHRVRREAAFSADFGHAHVILVAGDHLAGATDPRPRTGDAAGW